jgi:hypothetical protein
VVILYGKGDGTFTSKTFAENFFVEQASSFDVNQTGRSDLMVVTSCDVIACKASMGALFGTASRTLTQSLTHPQRFDSRQLAVADLNGDLRNDLIDSYFNLSTEGALLALATSPSAWSKHIQLPVSETGDGFSLVFAGDFNRDRKPDVALYNGTMGVIQELVNTTSSGNYGTCAYPRGGQGIHVCTPTSGSFRHSPVRFTAAANSFQPIRKLELWIDGHKVTEQFRTWLDFTTPIAVGTHKITLFANGYDDDFQRTLFSFTVN